MKSILRKLVLLVLKRLAKFRLRKFSGKVIAVTGSVGKTSTKEAIFSVLNTKYRVKKSNKSMNTEFGLLLTILDIESGYSSAFKWSWLLTKAFFHALSKDCSEIMLLEYGVDKKGDMDFLLSVLRPDIAVFTGVYPLHLADGQFNNLEEIFEEKSKLIEKLNEGGTAILNRDNEYSRRLNKRGTIGYGKEEGATYQIGRIKNELAGISFNLKEGEDKHPIHSSLIGAHQAYVLAPAFICGRLMNIDVESILYALEKFELPPGRMNLIEGQDGSLILDSTYNSSPVALKESLETLYKVGEGYRKIAVLGNMNELGEATKELHLEAGLVAGKCCDVLITVGTDAKYIAEAAIEAGMDQKNVFSVTHTKEAIEAFSEEVKNGDLVLVKGSQNRVRLEKFVKSIMADPETAKDLLVRQEKVWQNKL